MSNYTKQQYAESAAKHGIPCGPYTTRRIDKARRVESSGDSWERAEIDVSTDDCDVDMAVRLAKQVEQLPNLLIERDALKAENERLRKALETLRNLHTDAVFACGVDDEQRAHEALMSADAALTGGGA